MQAVLFDLGNTLVGYYGSAGCRPILRKGLRNAAHALGVVWDEETEDEVFQQALVLNHEPSSYAVRPLEGRLRQLFHQQAEYDDAAIQAACEAFVAPIVATATPDPEALPVLDELRRRGMKTAIVSNSAWGSASKPWHEELRRHGLRDRVDAVVFCVDVGWRKPHRAPFDRALELLGVQADQAVFVGDHPEWDVLGAREVGLRPILLSPSGSSASGCPVVHSLSEVLKAVNTID